MNSQNAEVSFLKQAICRVNSRMEAISETLQLPGSIIKTLGANYKKILRLSYDVIITYDNRKSNLR